MIAARLELQHLAGLHLEPGQRPQSSSRCCPSPSRGSRRCWQRGCRPPPGSRPPGCPLNCMKAPVAFWADTVPRTHGLDTSRSAAAATPAENRPPGPGPRILTEKVHARISLVGKPHDLTRSPAHVKGTPAELRPYKPQARSVAMQCSLTRPGGTFPPSRASKAGFPPPKAPNVQEIRRPVRPCPPGRPHPVARPASSGTPRLASPRGAGGAVPARPST